ncbi:TonB-dependent receptor [Marinilongibacter aquaticus]|uniref:SusC/RagA family TonB-linked outer membrane protein n=1 Tax=Marinilongibacter aquaticus TaxID=2975157 RepID=UPI0021BD9A89|nr:TonB-dependent receptor [Marinilongibacter aquaticus]UBM59141.1 TonB-dependent receptor [Marinilongibacter aquaticus]
MMKRIHLKGFALLVLVFSSIQAIAQSTINGTVFDHNKEPLVGVSVAVKGTSIGSITDIDGKYAIAASAKDELVFSYIGYKGQTVIVGNQSVIDITLEEDSQALDEVVVVGYGVAKKKDLTGSVGTVDSKKLKDMPASRVDQMLQGRAAGVLVTSANGAPGARSTIRIRGGNSINANNEPLYVIDGFIVGTDFNLNNINTNDIESIEVLKDATAISIYGTRGANGVIMVTTKSGDAFKGSKPTVSLNMYTGIQKMARKIDYLNGYERADYGTEFAKNSNSADPFADKSEVADTDWQDLISQNGAISNLDLSVGGNTKDLNYYISSNYFNQQGIIKGTSLERYNLRTNLDFKLNKKLKAGIRMNGTFTKTDNDKVDLWNMRLALTSYPSYYPDGSFWDQNIVQGGALRNPLADIALSTNFTYGTNLLTTAYVEYSPWKNITFRSTIGPKINWTKQNQFDPGDLPVRAAAQQGGYARIDDSFEFDILQENTVTFDKDINAHNHLNLLAGFTWQKGHKETAYAQTQGLSINAISYDNLSIGDPLSYRIGSDLTNSRQLVSWLARANYTLMDKYIFTAVGRVDGASVYSGSNNAYAFFPSVAFAWRIIDEQFMKNQNLFSNLKLRMSYGSAGKESVDPYSTLAVLNNNVLVFNDTQTIGIQRGRPANPELKWETTDQLDIGLEFGFLNNRISGELDYYYKKTKDLLLARQIPKVTGFDTKLENIGSIQNQGLELMINTINIDKKDFSWRSTVTLSGNRSKILNLAGVDEIVIYSLEQGGPGAKLIPGKPVGVFTGVQYLGTYKSQEEIDADGDLGVRQVVGGPRFKDENGDGKINNDDHVIMGNPEPKIFGGINNSFRYKNFTLDVFLQGTLGNDIYHEYNQQGFFGLSEVNVYAEQRNRWTPDNPTSNVPRAGSVASLSDVVSNSAMLEDGSHLRLKTLKLEYNLPVKSDVVKSLSVYGVGSNVFLLSKFRGYDPESTRFGTNSTVRGVIRNQYPNSKTFTVGLKANF